MPVTAKIKLSSLDRHHVFVKNHLILNIEWKYAGEINSAWTIKNIYYLVKMQIKCKFVNFNKGKMFIFLKYWF